MTDIFKPNTPKIYKYEPDFEEPDPWLWWLLTPLATALVVIGLTAIVDFFFIWFPLSEQLWWTPATLVAFTGWSLPPLWYLRRNQYIEHTTKSRTMKLIHENYYDLPSELRAEMASIYNMALDFDRSHNNDGLNRCYRLMNEAQAIFHQREVVTKARAANSPEIWDAMAALNKYSDETSNLFRGELEGPPRKIKEDDITKSNEDVVTPEPIDRPSARLIPHDMDIIDLDRF